MRIMVRGKGDKGWKPLDASKYDSEAHLQDLLDRDISLIPVEPPLIACVREFGLPGSGSSDIIAVDGDGAITIIECKLAKSREVRRMVIGQLLEYAAFLTKMSADEFVGTFDDLADAPLYQTMADRLGEEFEESAFKDALTENLNQGEFTLIVAVDKINDELREIILYLNAHSDCTVGALELEYFKDSQRELLVPRLYGGPEVKEATARQSTKRTYRKWSKESFFEAAAQHLDNESLRALHDLYDFTKREADELKWGGSKYGAFGFRAFDGNNMVSIFYVFGSGNFWIHFNYLTWVSEDIAGSLDEFRRKLNAIPGISLDETRNLSQDAEVEYTGTFDIETLRKKSSLSKFQEAVLWMRDVVRSYNTEGKTYTKETKTWDKDSFFKALKEDAEEHEVTEADIRGFEELLDFTEKNADRTTWGKGRNSGAFCFKVQGKDGREITIFDAWTFGDVQIHFNLIFRRLNPTSRQTTLEEFRRRLNTVGASIEKKPFESYMPWITTHFLRDETTLKTFKEAVLWMKDKIRSYEEK